MAAAGEVRQDPAAVNAVAAGRVCDTHVHVFDPGRFPYVTPRRFTPGEAGVDRLRAHLERLGASRVVLVQPSVYGSDHRCLLDGLRALDGAGRAVAVLAADAGADAVHALDRAGVRATRLNLVVDGIVDVDFARREIARVSRQIPARWHIQLHVGLPLVAALHATLAAGSRHVVLDHLGLPDGPAALQSDGWRALRDLAARGRASVKLSAPYLAAGATPPWHVLEPFVASLAEARPGALLWGSNWPHTQGTARSGTACLDQTEPFREVDDGAWLRQCQEWIARLQLPHGLLDDNAERLYGF